jgi:hypothetical protein
LRKLLNNSCLEHAIPVGVRLREGVLNVLKQWVFLAQSQQIVRHLLKGHTGLASLELILVRIFWVLVEHSICVAVYTDLEHWPEVRIKGRLGGLSWLAVGRRT